MALLVVLLSACGASSGPGSDSGGTKQHDPGVTDTEIVIGTFGPLTGPAAAWGDTVKATAAYFDYVNEQGGIHGRKVRFIIEDDQYQPSKTVAAVKKMVEQDKVFALVNVVGTSTLSAVKDYLIEHGVPVIFYSNGSTKFQGIPTFFAGLMPYATEAKILVRYAAETLGAKRFAVFYQNDDMGKDALNAIHEAVPKLGGEVVEAVAYNPADVDVSAYVLKLRESGADAVLVWATVKHGALVLKEAQKIGFSPNWLLSSVTASHQLPELAEGAADGVYTVGGSATLKDTDNVVVQHYLEHHAKYLENGPNATQLGGWNAGRSLTEALNRAGRDLTCEGLIAALETFENFQGLAQITYTKDDHVGVRRGWIRQIQGTEFVKITDYIDTDY